MADPRFFQNHGPFSIGELADVAGDGARIDGDPDLSVADVAPLDVASAGQISFLDNRKYVAAFEVSEAQPVLSRRSSRIARLTV